MGVYHFAGLGRSPGAVTTALSYLQNEMSSTFEDGEIVEAVVIFTSKLVICEEDKIDGARRFILNQYMSRHEECDAPFNNPVKVVQWFIKEKLPHAELYLVEVDVNDFLACFEAAAKTLLHFHSPGKVGKHIWVNLTGGTNILNAALMQVAAISGLIPKVYYTFIADVAKDGIYLQPFSQNESEFEYREVDVIPTTFDKRYSYLLKELNTICNIEGEQWIDSAKLLRRLKSKYPLIFQKLSLNEFIRNYLNVWPGIRRQGSRQTGQKDAVQLSNEGKKMLDLLNKPWFIPLLKRKSLSEEQKKRAIENLKILDIGNDRPIPKYDCPQSQRKAKYGD